MHLFICYLCHPLNSCAVEIDYLVDELSIELAEHFFERDMILLRAEIDLQV